LQGPYPNVELSHVRVSDPFLRLEYILVVRNLPPLKLRDGLAGPFLPMDTNVREKKVLIENVSIDKTKFLYDILRHGWSFLRF